MKKKISIIIVIFIIVFSSINVFAENGLISTQLDEVNNRSKIKIEYNKDEQKELDNIPKIGCKAVYIAEPITGKIIYEKNAHEKMYPASTTKILTALVVMENCNLNEKAKVSKRAIDLVPENYSNANLQVGEELTISDLLYALLVPSANEAANVLAEHVSGSVEEFIELCNKRAKELGCENLHFVNTNGIHDDNHYCTAYDLYLIAKECRKYEIFNEIVKTKSYTLPSNNNYPRNDRVLKNTNYMLFSNMPSYYFEYCNGIKTGHTTPAGECFVGSSLKDNIELISVVLGGGTNSKGLNERFYDTKQLFEFVYNNYSIKEIVNKGQVIKTIEVEKATKETALLDIVVDEDIYSIVPNEIDINNIEKIVEIDNSIVAPIEENQVLGKITYKVDGLNYTVDLVASHSVEKFPYWLYNCIFVCCVLILLVILEVVLKSKKNKRKKKT